MCGISATAPLYKQKFQIESDTGQFDREGNPLYSDPIEYRARIVERFRRIVNDAGDEVVSSITINVLQPDINVKATDRITVEGKQPRILAVESFPCEVGHKHKRILT